MKYGERLPGGQTLAQWYDDLQEEENDAAIKENRAPIVLNPEYLAAKNTELFPFLKWYLDIFYELSWYRPQSLSGIHHLPYETVNLYLDNMGIPFTPTEKKDMLSWMATIDRIYISELMMAESQRGKNNNG